MKTTTILNQKSELDIAVAQQLVDRENNCPIFPRNRDIENAIRNATDRKIWFVKPSGTSAEIYNVDLAFIDENNLTLSLAGEDIRKGKKLQSGMSGSIVVFDGLPVAIVQNVSTEVNEVVAYGLNAFRYHFPNTGIDEVSDDELLNPIRTIVRDNRFIPRNISKLPLSIQEVVRKARENRRLAEEAATNAADVKMRAEDRAAMAKRFPREEVHSGLAHFRGENGNDIAGEVWKKDNPDGSYSYGTEGYGVSVIGEGIYRGNKYSCRFSKDIGCEGMGTVEYAINEDNTVNLGVWYGDLTKGNPKGQIGRLTWKCISENGADQGWFYRNAANPTPGVWEMCDGRIFEGEMTNRLNGKGVFWDKNGKMIAIGVWKDGTMSEVYNEEWAVLREVDFSDKGSEFRQAKLLDDRKARVSALKELCGKNHALSCNDYGYYVKRGEGTRRDYQEAMEAYEKACDASLNVGCLNVGSMYESGEGGEVNIRAAITEYIRACEMAEYLGCEWAADLLEKNPGMSNDFVAAEDLYLLACEGGRDDACRAINIAVEYK